MKVPLIALVGRPNVGKSTLFNRLLGRRAAIVDDSPGVTRDRLFGEARLGGHLVRLVDTGGIESGGDSLMQRVKKQSELAIEEADVIVLVLDSVSGTTPADAEVTRILRRSGKPFFAVANKSDIQAHDERALALYELGLDVVVPISAEHGRGLEDLAREVFARVKAPLADEQEKDEGPINVEAAAAEDDPEEPGPEPTRIEWTGGPIRVAVVGRPNVGKSSLINRLLGEERHLASDLPGTTRDSIDSELAFGDQRFVFTDTAGIRRKRSIDERLEKFAVMMAMRALDGADVAVIVLAANEPPSDQDARIASMATERGKGVILALNKWDLVGTEEGKEIPDAIERQLGFVQSFAPVIRVSAKTGRGLEGVLAAVVEAQRERHRRVSTGELNRFFRDVVEDSPPPIHKGRRPKLFFVSQPLVRPPTFIFTASHTEDVRESYTRYLTNALRKRYGFRGTPIWIKMRGKGRKDKDT
jgi:GTPase